MRDDKPKGLKLRGTLWWIDKTVRIGDLRIQLRESTGCRTLADARLVLARRDAETRRTAHPVRPPVAEPTERTFAEAAAKYIVDLERRAKSSERALYALALVMDTIGDYPLSHVHQANLQHWIDAQQGLRASGTIERTLQTISTVLRYAAEVLRDGNTPWMRTVPPKFRVPDWGKRQPRPITWEEQDRLVRQLPAHLVGPVLLALATGARQGEITTLRWDQQREIEQLPRFAAWWIPPEIRKANSRRRTSDQEGRYLICNRAARSVIEGQLGQSPDWVFPSPVDGHLYRVSNHGWRTARTAVALPIRFHDLRHTFGRRAADAGIPLDIRRSLLGHEHRDITLHYSSPGLARLLEEAERIVRPAVRLASVC